MLSKVMHYGSKDRYSTYFLQQIHCGSELLEVRHSVIQCDAGHMTVDSQYKQRCLLTSSKSVDLLSCQLCICKSHHVHTFINNKLLF